MNENITEVLLRAFVVRQRNAELTNKMKNVRISIPSLIYISLIRHEVGIV